MERAICPKEGELVIKLDSAETQDRNIVSMTEALVQRTVLVGIRYVLEDSLEDSIDLNLTKNLLAEIGNRKVLDWYMDTEYMPKVHQSKLHKEWNSKIIEIDERGLFTRLLLVELDPYAKKIVGRPKTQYMVAEIETLIEFIYRIASKSYGENAPLDIITPNIKIGVLLVGQTAKVLNSIDPYMMAFCRKLDKRAEAIYLISFCSEFLKERDEESERAFENMKTYLHQEIDRSFEVEKDFELDYLCFDVKGMKRKAKCLRYRPIYS